MCCWSPGQALYGQPIGDARLVGKGGKLTSKTDIWSWGFSVLEMFAGEIFWHSGEAAAHALEDYWEHGGEKPAIPPMPVGLVELLWECFRDEPPLRPDAKEVVDRLKEVYREAVGRAYAHGLAALPEVRCGVAVGERRSREGAEWRDGREWLERALRAAGRNPAEAEGILARRGMTRRGELVAQIVAYEEAKAIFERLLGEGWREWEAGLAVWRLK